MIDPNTKVIGTGLLLEDKDKEILVLQRKRSPNNQSEVEYKFHTSYGDPRLFSSDQLSADNEYSDRHDNARLSLATADFRGQASIQSNKNTNQSM